MQYIDHPQTGRQAIVNPELAVISGQIKASNIDELRRFRRAFPLNPSVLLNIANEVRPQWEAKGKVTAKDKTDIVFRKLIPACFAPAAAAGWNANLHFHITGAASYTVAVKNGKVDIQDGVQGQPTSVITMDAPTFSSIMRFQALESADQLDDVKIVDDESADTELDDERLALVAGGKGSSACGGEACGGDACGGAACGGAACGGDTCGGAACAGAACGAAGCAADACGGAACVGAACAGAACAGAACAGDAAAGGACAGDACGAAACAGAACAGDACGAAACAADICAGEACGVDVSPGPDIGPCAINIIPCLPGI